MYRAATTTANRYATSIRVHTHLTYRKSHPSQWGHILRPYRIIHAARPNVKPQGAQDMGVAKNSNTKCRGTLAKLDFEAIVTMYEVGKRGHDD